MSTRYLALTLAAAYLFGSMCVGVSYAAEEDEKPEKEEGKTVIIGAEGGEVEVEAPHKCRTCGVITIRVSYPPRDGVPTVKGTMGNEDSANLDPDEKEQFNNCMTAAQAIADATYWGQMAYNDLFDGEGNLLPKGKQGPYADYDNMKSQEKGRNDAKTKWDENKCGELLNDEVAANIGTVAQTAAN